MRILVTAGNTQTPIDQVRCITNIFTGRTGGLIALEAHRLGHQVCLLTSQPEVIKELSDQPPAGPRWEVTAYRTFDDLHSLMSQRLGSSSSERFDAVIHAAAVSDYQVAGIYARKPVPSGATLEDQSVDVSKGKVKSSHEELWLKLGPTPKLVDLIRSSWGFRGVLVKFKLEVGVSEQELLDIAEKARIQSQADLMAANTLEGMHTWAYLGPIDGQYHKVSRRDLAPRLLAAVEALHTARSRK